MKKADWLAFFDFLLMGLAGGFGGVIVSTEASKYDEVEEFNREVFGESDDVGN